MDQFDHGNLAIQLQKYQYSYIKPQAELRQLLLNVEDYNFLVEQIKDYDAMKLKRLLRFLKKKDNPQLIDLCLSKGVKIGIPLNQIDVKKNYHLKFISKQKSEDLRQNLLKRLKEEFIIDNKSKQVGFLQFSSQFTEILEFQDIAQLIDGAIKLTKRSDSNLDTLLKLLTQINIDISPIMNSIQEGLQEYVKNDIAIQCLQAAFKLVKDPAQLQQSFQYVQKLINTTMDDAKKIQYFNILNPREEIAGDQFKLALQICSVLQNEQQTFDLYNFIIKLNYELKDVAQLKKLLSLNKFSTTLIQLLVADKLSKNKESTKELDELMVIISNNLSTNFKNFAKVVTQTVLFLSALKCAILYLHYWEEEGPGNLIIGLLEAINKNTEIFQSKSHLSQLKYLINPSCKEETVLFLECLFLHYAFINETEAEYDGSLMPFILINSFQGKSQSVDIHPIIQQAKQLCVRDDKIKFETIIDYLFQSFKQFLYQVNPNQQDFKKEKLNQFAYQLLRYVSGNVNQTVALCYSNALISQKLSQKLKAKQLEVDAIEILQQLQSYNQNTRQSYINYFVFLINNGYFDKLISQLLVFLDPNNLKTAKELPEPQDLENQDTSLLNRIGVQTLLDIKPLSQEEIQLQQELLKSKQKVMMMDENEVRVSNMKRHKEKLLKFYQLCLKLLTGSLQNKDVAQKLLEFFYDPISYFASEQDFRMEFVIFSVRLLRRFQLTQQYEWPISEFFLHRAQGTLPDEKVCTKIKQFYDNLKDIKQESIFKLIHYINLYIISQKSFEVSLKFRVFNFVIQYKYMIGSYFQPFLQNINICAHAKNSVDLLKIIIKDQVFEDILNYVYEAQMCILKSIQKAPNDFAVQLKLRILQKQEEIAELTNQHVQELDINGLKDWNMTHFIEVSSREHVEFMIQILKQYNPAIFPEKICESAQQLLHKLDDEQLEFFPYFALTYQNIPTEIIPRIIDLLVQYTADEHRVKLVDLAQEAGIHLIKTRAKECAKEILVVLEKQLQNKHSSASICALVFLGILSPFIKAQNNLQKQILQLIQKSSQQVQYNLARCLPDLLSFFPDAPQMISDILANNKNEKDDLVRRGNCYLVAGLLRGLGVQELDNMKILNRIEKEAIGGKKETIQEKEAIVIQVQALIEIFGRLLEPYIIQVMGILMKYFGENKVQIRDIAINAARTIMSKMTSYGVKIMLPNLLQGLDADLQWRGKQANIQALGNMAYCSPKQISSRLPLIVSSISKAISDTHPEVRRSANESLNQIGSTIKNPEISSISDILILALSNPYDQNIKGLEVILQTKFNHYIDAPAMSLIIPLIDYAFRSQESKQKKYGAIVVGSLPLLLQKAEDLVPYMDLIIGGLEFVIGDPLVDVRTIAAQAIGQISKKIGIPNTKIFFKFIWDILENKEANSIKRSGAAHALAEMICIHDKDYFEDSMQFIYEQIQRPELHIKEGYIGTFIYIPTIKRDTFQDYVKDVLENIYDCVSHEEEAISSITLRVLKIIIKNYGVIQNELLYPALTEAMLNRDWKRRYAGVLLSGEMLRIALKIVKEQYDKPSSPQYINIEMYNQNLMMLYVCCQDIAEQVRLSADSLWKELIENTPRTVKRGLRQIARHLCQLIINIPQVAENTVSNFCQKYGNDNKLEFINHIRIIFIDETNLSIIRGGYLVLNSLYKYLDFDFLNNHRSLLIEISRIHLINQDPLLQQALFQSIGQMIIRIKSTIFVEELVEPYLEQLAEMDELDANYSKYLEIFNQLCQLNQPLILHYLVLLILVPPLHQYKIEILTNNAQTFGQVIYKKYDGTVPISFLFEDLFQNAQFEKEWDQRTISLLYCIGQLSVNLKIEPENYVQIFVKDILEQIEVRSRPIIQDIDVQKNYKYLLLTLEILQYFLQNSSEEYHAFNNDIIPKAIPYLFIQNPLLAQNQQDRLIKVCNKIIYDVNNHLKKDVHCENMKIIHTCFTNRKGLQIPGLNADEGIIPYQSMIIDTLIFGKDEYFRYAIDFINLLIDRAQPENLQQPLLKIVGALIRILHYKMSLENKYLALQTLEKALAIDLSQFNPQLLITYDKLIVEMNKIDHGLKQLSRNYSKLIRDHIKRDLIVNQLFNKAIQGETTEIRECHLTIVKKILKDQTKIEDQLYSSAVLERIFILGKQYFDKCINEKKNHAGEFTQLGLILAVAYNYSSKQHKESYLQKQLILGQPNILLRLQFNRFNKFELQETRQYAEKELNQESVYARYIEKTLRKLK